MSRLVRDIIDSVMRSFFRSASREAGYQASRYASQTGRAAVGMAMKKVGLSQAELQTLMNGGLEALAEQMPELKAARGAAGTGPVQFKSDTTTVTDFAPHPKAYWEQQHSIYTLEIFADQASVAIFGDEAEATAYVKHRACNHICVKVERSKSDCRAHGMDCKRTLSPFMTP